MDVLDLREIRRLYCEGVNVMDYLREQLGTRVNTEQLVEIAYDMQAGSYVDIVRNEPARFTAYHDELGSILAPLIQKNSSILDVGTGEMTTLSAVAAGCYGEVAQAYAADISLSRLLVGVRHAKGSLAAELFATLRPVVSTLFRLPFADDSVDIVWTAHALEPNGGREAEAISELARVARRWLVLFEPSYEHNSPAGRARMEALGYIKGLPQAIGRCRGVALESTVRIQSTENPLNPTYAYIVRKERAAELRTTEFRCPLSHGELDQRSGYMYCDASLLAYPVIEGIPVLRIEKAISASALEGGRYR